MANEDRVLDALHHHVNAVFATFHVTPSEGAQLIARLAEELTAALPAAEVAAPEPEDMELDALFDALSDEPDLLDEPPPVIVPPPAEEPEAAPEEAPAPIVRSAPRFAVDAPVELFFGDQEALKEVWMRDISKGGLFIETAEPPPLDTELTVALTTPDGRVELEAKVVHVVEAERATALGSKPGIGVQFGDLDLSTQIALEAYVDGVAEELSAAPRIEAADAEADDAKHFLRVLQEGDVYAALDIDAALSTDDVIAAMDRMVEHFTIGGQPANIATRLEAARAAIERFRKVVSSPARRLAYDFMNGHVRAEERMATTDPKLLRSVWARVFPDQAKSARALARRAQEAADAGRYDEGVKLGSMSLEADPFQHLLRAAHAGWAGRDEIAERMRTGDDPAMLRALAASQGVDAKELRETWARVHPDRVERAKAQAKHALQAKQLKMADAAIEAAGRALALDPFNLELEDAINQWRSELIAEAVDE
jgi:Tfp pilus assembly protein PilZ